MCNGRARRAVQAGVAVERVTRLFTSPVKVCRTSREVDMRSYQRRVFMAIDCPSMCKGPVWE